MTEQVKHVDGELSKEQLNVRMDNIVELIQKEGCQRLAAAAALDIVDGGAQGTHNTYVLFPQLFVRTGNTLDYDARLNLDGNTKADGSANVEEHEVAAFMLAAAQLHAGGVAYSEIKIDDTLIALAKEKCKDVQKTSCPVR